MILSGRRRWLGAAAAGLLAVVLVLFWTRKDLDVVVYNNTGQPFQKVTVSVGNQTREAPMLDAMASIVFDFRAVDSSSDVRLSLDADPPLRWSAPSLATASLARVTLRVNEGGSVTVTLEKSWGAQLSNWLE